MAAAIRMMGHGKVETCIGIGCHRNETAEVSAPGLLLVKKSALQRLEDSAPVSGDAPTSVSPKHLVGQWGDDEKKDVGGFFHAEIRAGSSMGMERLSDQGRVPGESSFPLYHSLA